MRGQGARVLRIEQEEHAALPPPKATDGAASHRSRFRAVKIGAAVLASVLLALVVSLLTRSSGEAREAEPPPTVTVRPAEEASWRDELTAVGTFDAIQGVEVTTELAGTVTEIAFENGAAVEAGDPLLALDTSTEVAELSALQAQATRARLAYERQLRLIERGATSDAEVEDARAAWQDLSGQVDETQARIDKKRIEAPFSGTLGIRRVSLGEYVGPGTAIVSLQTVSPIFVDFDLPERSLDRLTEALPVAVRTDAFGDRVFEGVVTALSPDVEEGTRSLTVQATVLNEDRSLRPGMFADVTVRLPGERRVVVVPATAITRNAYGTSVYVVGPPEPKPADERGPSEEDGQARASGGEGDGFLARLFGSEEEEDGERAGLVAKSVFVATGEQRDLMVEVTEGVSPGDRVVTAGQLKLDDGVAVRVSDRDVTEGAETTPEAP